jgi:hypothetical protein
MQESNYEAKVDLDKAESRLQLAQSASTVENAVSLMTEAYQHIVSGRRWIERARNLKVLDKTLSVTLRRVETLYDQMRSALQSRPASHVAPDFPESTFDPERQPGQVLVKWWPLPITSPSSPGFALQTMFAEEEIAQRLGIRRIDVRTLKERPDSTASILNSIAATLPPRHHYALSNWKEPEKSMFWHPEGYATWIIAECIGYVLRRLLEEGIRPQFRQVSDEEAVKRYISSQCQFYERPMSQPEAGRIFGLPGVAPERTWTSSIGKIREHYTLLMKTLDPAEADQESMLAIADERVNVQKAFYRILAERYLRVGTNHTLSRIESEKYPLNKGDGEYVAGIVKQLLGERCVRELRRSGLLVLRPTGPEVEKCVKQKLVELANLHLQLGQNPVA